jgi:hypothetical protein
MIEGTLVSDQLLSKWSEGLLPGVLKRVIFIPENVLEKPAPV